MRRESAMCDEGNGRVFVGANVRRKCTLSYHNKRARVYERDVCTSYTKPTYNLHTNTLHTRVNVVMRASRASERVPACARVLNTARGLSQFASQSLINKVLRGITSKLHLILCASAACTMRISAAALVYKRTQNASTLPPHGRHF